MIVNFSPRMNKTKIVFFGTHNFACTILQGLFDNSGIEVMSVVTQPDKPVGRKKILTPPPVKILAESLGLSVEQPESLNNYELEIKNWDLGVTAQYGLLIPKSILDLPRRGMINVHTSLLPKYRGASPIQTAIINGEIETGVTIMMMDIGLDTGPILLQKSAIIAKDATYLTLEEKLAKIGSQALLEAIPEYMDGELQPYPQDESLATYCRQFTRDDGRIDWSRSASDILRQYRGLTPWPGMWSTLRDKRLKLLDIKVSDKKIDSGKIMIMENKMFVGCESGSIEVVQLQLEGKKAMDVANFLKGNAHVDGSVLE